MFIFIIKFILFFVPLLIAIAFLTLLERKIIASFQQRKGPNVVGFLGLLQPLADGIKLFLKESTFPSFISILLFLLAPLITFSCAIALWYVIPFSYWNSLVNFDLNVLYVLILSSFGVYGIILSGWASNSKYAFLGALRASAQMISYEVSLTLIILHLIIFTKSFNLLDIIEFQKDIWFIIPLFPSFLLFFISSLAETNRTPFDLAEAEGELVAGYNVEYSALTFALFFLGEYSNIIFMSVLTTVLFCGGWDIIFFFDFFYEILQFFFIKTIKLFYLTINENNIINYLSDYSLYNYNNKHFLEFYYEYNALNFLDLANNFFHKIEKNYFLTMFFVFTIKIIVFIFFFVWTRATYPRYRYNQLMILGWKIFLPLSLGILTLNYSINLIFLL